jgi:hypothetical protein
LSIVQQIIHFSAESLYFLYQIKLLLRLLIAKIIEKVCFFDKWIDFRHKFVKMDLKSSGWELLSYSVLLELEIVCSEYPFMCIPYYTQINLTSKLASLWWALTNTG